MSDSAHIAARWRYWEPLEVIASLQRQVPRLQYMVAARRRHEEAAMACRLSGLSWDVIERHALDDPRTSDEDRRDAIRAAQERMRTRVGHVKQKVFERYKRRNQNAQ
jgi:hypothetical protein